MSLLGTNRKLNREAAHNERKPASSVYRKRARPAGAPRRERASRAGATPRATPRPPQNAERPAGGDPLRASLGACGACGAHVHVEKRPPRARRPALPQPCAAVLSAKAGLTAGFGMGPGDPRLCGRARGGRSPAALIFEPARSPYRGDPGGRMAGTDRRWRIALGALIEDAKSSGY